MSKCVKRLINRLWQNEPISAFPEGGIMIWPGPREPREGRGIRLLIFLEYSSAKYAEKTLWYARSEDDKKGGLLLLLDIAASIVWTYLNFLGNEIFQWKIVSYAKTWRNWSTAKEQLAQNCRKVHLGNNTRSSGDLLWISRHWILTCRAIFLM